MWGKDQNRYTGIQWLLILGGITLALWIHLTVKAFHSLVSQEGVSMRDDPVVRAPDFPANARWFNIVRPLRLSDLRGRFVLLDFWTFC